MANDSLDTVRKAYEKLQAELAAMDEEVAPILAEGKAITAQIEQLKASQRESSKKLLAVRNEDYVAKKKLLGQLAVALGGLKLTAEQMQ